MKRLLILTALTALGISPTAFADGSACYQPDFAVIPFELNNSRNVVASEWRNSIGCPSDGLNPSGPDLLFGCAFTQDTTTNSAGQLTGAPTDTNVANDSGNQGLLLSKTVSTTDPSVAGAELKGVRGIQMCELGYDLRKPFAYGAGIYGSAGSHCGPKSARFEFTTQDRQGNSHVSCAYMDGCQLPPPAQEFANYWQRLRWGTVAGSGFPVVTTCDPLNPVYVDISGQRVQRIRIMFDEGPDQPTTIDGFALAVLDNIDVNGALVGSGPKRTYYDDEDHGEGRDGNGRYYKFHDSPSNPNDGAFQYDDPSGNEHVQSVNGFTSITYTTGSLGQQCVNIAGPATVNGSAGYTYTFVGCDLWLFGGLGSFTMTVAGGPLGSVPYQAQSTLTSGYISLHQ